MDIRHLEYFSEVARLLSFTKAASTLHVSQPSLSKAIQNLENELGVQLFYRSPKQLELTDAGKAVLVNAKHVLDAFKNLTSELTDISNLKKGEIKIGIPPIMGAAFFSKLISQYKEIYPLVQIHLTEVGSKKIKEGVEDGSLDIGLVCNIPIKSDMFEVIRLLNDPLLAIMHKENPLAKKEVIQLSDLQNEPFVLYRKDFSLYDRIIDVCSRNGFSPIIACESSQKDFIVEMVGAKLGVALLPSKICNEIKNKEIVSKAIPFSELSLELGMIWKKNKYLSFAVREFIAMSEQYLEDETAI
ncbi:LysR family transcriptional regulator [Calidifontibacillus oryziterrae]|uniref:LysR family transcriptional regulator n=1 Tax=Calidifontibacillus oryziterrae TaxID=1191699 RepID=UPI000307BABD|nr:LysR family transcriptional regulator [Calidifontibacillus oryziterrae]